MADEWTQLELSNQRIQDAERRIAKLVALIRQLVVEGRDTGDAESLLRFMHKTLATFYESQNLIIAGSKDREGGPVDRRAIIRYIGNN